MLDAATGLSKNIARPARSSFVSSHLRVCRRNNITPLWKFVSGKLDSLEDATFLRNNATDRMRHDDAGIANRLTRIADSRYDPRYDRTTWLIAHVSRVSTRGACRCPCLAKGATGRRRRVVSRYYAHCHLSLSLSLGFRGMCVCVRD